MQAYEFLLNDEQTLRVPWWWFNALMVWSGAVGVVLWLFGRQLVKPIFAIITAGVVAILTAVLVGLAFDDMPLTYWLIGGALVGAAMGWLLARLALAIFFALCLGLLAPWLVLVIEGTPIPPVHEQIVNVIAELREATGDAIEIQFDDEPAAPADNAGDDTGNGDTGNGGATEADTDAAERTTGDDLPSLREAYDEVRQQMRDIWDEWWADRSGGTRWAILSAAGGAVVVGGALALVLPNLVGAVMTSLLGVLLMLWPVSQGLAMLPERATAWVPREGTQLAILLVLFVLLGALFQWAIFRQPRKKGE